MESTLGWIDLSPAAWRRLRQDLEEKPDGVVDEMGVLAIHSGYADQFFPGTSVLHKRPRYVFFTSWNYLSLDRVGGPSPKARKELAEDWVKQQLKHTDQKGIIGDRGDRPAQPVDFIYWTALNKWGFYRGPGRSKLFAKWKEYSPRRVQAHDENDEHAGESPSATFLLPGAPPHYWLHPRPRQPVTFDLTTNEAEFLQRR